MKSMLNGFGSFHNKYISYIISIVVICIVGFYGYANAEKLKYLLNFSHYTLFLLILLIFLNIFIRGLVNVYLYRIFSIRLLLSEGTGLAVLNTIGNQLPFAGGMVAKGIYLKQKYNLAYSNYLPVTVALYVCFIGVSGLLGLMALAYLHVFQGAPFYWTLLVVFTGFMVSTVSLWLPIAPGFFPNRLKKWLGKLDYGWQALGKSPSVLLKLCFLQIIVLSVMGTRYFFEFQMLSQDAAFAHCLLFSASTIVTRLMTFTPGAFGVREGIVGIVSKIVGFDFAMGAIAVMIDRLLILITTGIIGFLYFNFKPQKKQL